MLDGRADALDAGPPLRPQARALPVSMSAWVDSVFPLACAAAMRTSDGAALGDASNESAAAWRL